jgi:hypothetical protein
MEADACVFVFAFVKDEGWTRVVRSCCGDFLLVGEQYYERLTDLLHDIGGMQPCISAL